MIFIRRSCVTVAAAKVQMRGMEKGRDMGG
jgi:hypothetical protein